MAGVNPPRRATLREARKAQAQLCPGTEGQLQLDRR